jgi:two-component system chemotaxis sensor kinase CheA
VFVRAADSIFAIPTTHIERVVRLEPHEITTLEGKHAVLVDGQPIALTSLDEILQLPRQKQPDAHETTVRVALILEAAETRVACCVDEVLHEQEVLFKQLGPYLSQVPNVAGATVLGSGQVVPILHIPDLLKSVTTGARVYRGRSSETGDAETVTKSVLLAEDSVTSRMLLKGILESAGYLVTTAVDGLDALTIFQKTNFDLVVSDVEMPRMNGFELTTKIRSTSGAHLPVVLVTGLDSREDRERGIAAGADAYIVKTNFDQRNLLDVVQRLL